MKIAIIGTGISGLTTAYLLNKNHDVKVFEKKSHIGGHTHTHTIETNNGLLNIDTGFIVHNERTYPNFINLMNKLGVKRELSTMGFSVKSKSLEYAGESINTLFAQRSNLFNLKFLKMLSEMYKFGKDSKYKSKSTFDDITLGEFLFQNNYSDMFINSFILPMGAAIWSTPAEKMLLMPARFFIKFFYNHGMLEIFNRPKWWVISGGSKMYINKLVNDFSNKIHINTEVVSVFRKKNCVEITVDGSSSPEIFDNVVLANHSNQVLSILKDPSPKETEILSSIPYQKNHVTLHTDTSVLPKRKLAWASWNYYLDGNPTHPVMLTYNMNILQNLKAHQTYCVTLNDNGLINKDKILKKLIYHHPLFTNKGIEAQSRKHDISGTNNTYYCGAYWRNGFHEDGVVSALDVCKDFGESL